MEILANLLKRENSRKRADDDVVCATVASMKVRTQPCVRSAEVANLRVGFSDRLQLLEGSNGKASSCGDQYEWLKIRTAGGMQGFVTTRFTGKCREQPRQSTGGTVGPRGEVIRIDHDNPVHCGQKYKTSGDICAGNGVAGIIEQMQEFQETARREGSASAVFRLEVCRCFRCPMRLWCFFDYPYLFTIVAHRHLQRHHVDWWSDCRVCAKRRARFIPTFHCWPVHFR